VSVLLSFSFTAPPPTSLYSLSLHDALPILPPRDHRDRRPGRQRPGGARRRGSQRVRELGRRPGELLVHPAGRGDPRRPAAHRFRSEEHTSELQSRENLVCRLLLEKKKKTHI